MPTEYPAEFKRKVIQRYEKGESIKTLSQELNIYQDAIFDTKEKAFSGVKIPKKA